MTRTVVAGAALVVALAVGLGVGWLVFGGTDDRTDAAVACEEAETLPERLFEDASASDALRASAIATLAQAAGVRHDDLGDLDDLGEAGVGLQEALQTFDDERYAEARQGLLDACADH